MGLPVWLALEDRSYLWAITFCTYMYYDHPSAVAHSAKDQVLALSKVEPSGLTVWFEREGHDALGQKFHSSARCCFLFDLILYVPVNNLSVMSDGSSWVEPVLS